MRKFKNRYFSHIFVSPGDASMKNAGQVHTHEPIRSN